MNSQARGTREAEMRSSIIRKIKHLDRINESIRQLRAQINSLSAEKDQVEEEIASIQASSAPISRLPAELLGYIFLQVVQPSPLSARDFSAIPQKLAALLFVCKLWYNTTINTPVLWSFISAILPEGGSARDEIESINRQQRFMDVCMIRNKNTTLSVFLNFMRMGISQNKPIVDVKNLFEGLMEEHELGNWVDQIDWATCPWANAYGTRCQNIIRRAMGKAGSNMARWISLSLFLPGDDLFEPQLRHLLDQPTPQLRELTLSGRVYRGSATNSPIRFLPALPQIRELLLLSPFYLQSWPICPLVQKLRLRIESSDSVSSEVRFLEQFPGLKYLSFSGWPLVHRSFIGTADIVGFSSIQIPSLDCLELSCPLPSGFIEALATKDVTKLVVSFRSAFYGETDPIPTAKVFSVAQHFQYIPPLFQGFQEQQTLVHLSQLLPQLSNAHTLEVPDSILEVTQEAVARCKVQRKLPLLRSILTRRPNGHQLYHSLRVIE